MRRRIITLGVVVLILMIGVATASNDKAIFVDIQDSMDSWMQSTMQSGDLEKLPKALTQGDLFYRSQQLAELQVVRPANDALWMTHGIISSFCEGDLDYKHTIAVFSESKYAQQLDDLMRARKITDEIRTFPFAESCTKVVKCYYREQLLALGENIEEYNAYSNTIYSSCKDVVEITFERSLIQTNTLEIMENNNSGDEIFANGTLDDSPYDLLVTIEEIGDILFAHNDDASTIKYYDFDDISEIMGRTNDPADVEQYTEQEGVEERFEQYEEDLSPDSATSSYVSPTDPPEGRKDLNDDTGGGNAQGGGSIQNSDICVVPVEEEDEDEDDIIKKAEMLQDFVYDRNEQFAFDNLLAVKLGAMLSKEDQEFFGDDTVVDQRDLPESLTPAVANGISSAVEFVIAKLGDDQDAFAEFQAHVEQCVEQFTDEGKAGWRKITWKSITQPTAFTSCVFEKICKEVGDPSGRGMARVKICNVPSSRSYGTTSTQQVKSIEEIVDEIANRCYGLRESGQLLKHNKTKDHFGHKLEKIQLVDTLAFGLTVTFKPPPQTVEPSAEKRDQVENNKFLMKTILGFNDLLTLEEERNKYLVLAQPVATKYATQESTAAGARLKANAYEQSLNTTYPAGVRENQSQSAHYVKIHDEMIQFIEQNTQMWMFANEHVDSMKDTRQSRAKDFGAK